MRDSEPQCKGGGCPVSMQTVPECSVRAENLQAAEYPHQLPDPGGNQDEKRGRSQDLCNPRPHPTSGREVWQLRDWLEKGPVCELWASWIVKNPCSFLLLYFWPRSSPPVILVPRPGIEATTLALEVQSLNHWTTREVPTSFYVQRRHRFPPTVPSAILQRARRLR